MGLERAEVSDSYVSPLPSIIPSLIFHLLLFSRRPSRATKASERRDSRPTLSLVKVDLVLANYSLSSTAILAIG